MLSKLSEHKVILMTILFGLLGEFNLFSEQMNFLAVALGLGILLVSVAVYLPLQLKWVRTVVLSLAFIDVAAGLWVQPNYAAITLLCAAVISSVIAVRVLPSVGLLYFLGALLVAAWPLYTTWGSRSHITLIVCVGASAILALQTYEVAVRFHQYRRLSIYDELTGLHNVRYFWYKLHRYYEDEKVRQICLLLFDLDRFKAVNDKLGHRVGDEVLRRASTLLQSHASPAVVSRYGGEEFAVILANQTAESAIQLADKLRCAMEASVLCGVPVTLSCGVAHTHTAEIDGRLESISLFDGADRALYEAKKSRNCIRVYTPDLGEDEVAAASDPAPETVEIPAESETEAQVT